MAKLFRDPQSPKALLCPNGSAFSWHDTMPWRSQSSFRGCNRLFTLHSNYPLKPVYGKKFKHYPPQQKPQCSIQTGGNGLSQGARIKEILFGLSQMQPQDRALHLLKVCWTTARHWLSDTRGQLTWIKNMADHTHVHQGMLPQAPPTTDLKPHKTTQGQGVSSHL